MSRKSISFENHEAQLKTPFIIYVHLDSVRVHEESKIVHKPCGFGYSVKCSYDDALSKYEFYRGEDSSRVLWQKLEEEARNITAQLKRATFRLSTDEEKKFFWKSKFVPVVMDNFGKYGYNFLKKALDTNKDSSFFTIGQKHGLRRSLPSSLNLHFIDLRQIMNEKIENLEAILADSKKWKLVKEFKEEKFNLMKKVCRFPRFYVDSFSKFKEENFPDIGGFLDELHDANISQEEYERSAAIWKVFRCRNIGDYFSVYLKSNVFMLEDIFENFRKLCLNNYGLDPAHYHTIASFSWDSMLKYTGVHLEMLQDEEMIRFINGNIRGGITQCGKIHVQANDSTCITYFNVNSCYSWAMSQNLPISNFEWLPQSEIDDLLDKISSLDEDGDFGYFLEVDLEYPRYLQEKHKDLPFCYERNQGKSLTLFNKNNYGIELRALKQCLEHGLVLKKIHRVLKFKQCKWLEPYITYNTTFRAKAENDFENNLYKHLNNVIYGKTIQKTEGNNIPINWKTTQKPKRKHDKPIYVGFSILELSKMLMYDFHYNYIVPKYPNKVSLLYVDTDRFIYEIHTPNYFQDLKSDPKFLEVLDTSNLDPDLEIPTVNEKVVGKMKHEYGSKVIREFFSVCPKVYFLDIDGEEVKKAAGTMQYVKKKYISKDDYEKCVLHDEMITKSFWVTAAAEGEVVSQKVQRSVLSPEDWKR